MKKKILVVFVAVLAFAVLAVPVLAKPTNGPNKVAVTVTMIRNGASDGGGQGILLEDNVMTGSILHGHWEQHYFITLAFEDGSNITGTMVVERKVIVVPQKQSNRFIGTDYYVFTFDDGGFEGNGKVLIARGKSLGYGLFHGTGDFEGQTLNIGHGWEAFSSTPNPWIGYWLKP